MCVPWLLPLFSLASTDNTVLAFDIVVFWTFDTGRVLSNFLLGVSLPVAETREDDSSFPLLPFFIGFSAYSTMWIARILVVLNCRRRFTRTVLAVSMTARGIVSSPGVLFPPRRGFRVKVRHACDAGHGLSSRPARLSASGLSHERRSSFERSARHSAWIFSWQC